MIRFKSKLHSGYTLVAIMGLQSLLAGVEGEKEEDNKDGAEKSEEDHSDHQVHSCVGPAVLVVSSWVSQWSGPVHQVS